LNHAFYQTTNAASRAAQKQQQQRELLMSYRLPHSYSTRSIRHFFFDMSSSPLTTPLAFLRRVWDYQKEKEIKSIVYVQDRALATSFCTSLQPRDKRDVLLLQEEQPTEAAAAAATTFTTRFVLPIFFFFMF
jgi:hypothetical protein